MLPSPAATSAVLEMSGCVNECCVVPLSDVSFHFTQEHTADLKQRIEAQFSDLHQFLYQEEKLLQVKLKTEERRELIRLDEHKALLCVEISRLQRAVHEIEDKLKEQDPFTLLRVSSVHMNFAHDDLSPSGSY